MTLFRLCVLVALVAQVPGGGTATRYERTIAIAAPGPQRLGVDATLLAGAAPFTVVRRGVDQQRFVAEDGLSDLRLAGSDGREVPYLLVYPPVRDPQWLRSTVQPIAATEKTSGLEADLGSVQEVDGVDLRGLHGPFMKRFSLEASGDREHWTMVIPEGTLFDLPDQQLRQTDAGFMPGRYRYLRVVWDDTHSARVPLPPLVSIRLVTADAPAPPLNVPLQFERRPSEPGRSRYHVTLPASRFPIVALRLDAGGAYVFRAVTVTEPRLAAWQAAPVAIGQGLLVRDQSSQANAMVLRVAVQQPSRAEIDLVVEDGDNPPLDLRGMSAELAGLPWIYVDAPGPLVARYGDRRLARPAYDLEAARPSLKLDTLPEAKWAASTAQPLNASNPPPTDLAALGGAPLDVSSFHYSREIAAGPATLVALPLDGAVLAHSSGAAREFADVRIVDSGGRQVPRLVEYRPEPLVIPLRAEAGAPAAAELQARAGRNRSVYRIALPYETLPESRIVIGTSARVFRRQIQVGYEQPADRSHRDPWFMTVAAYEWSHADDPAPDTTLAGSPPRSADAMALTLPLPARSADAKALTLVIDEGDNSALPITEVKLLLPSYRLRFVRPASAARLVYGSTAIEAPQYDLALLAPAVLGASVAEVTMSAEAGTRAAAVEQLISPRMFWIVLVAAVLVLLGVLAALLRKTT